MGSQNKSEYIRLIMGVLAFIMIMLVYGVATVEGKDPNTDIINQLWPIFAAYFLGDMGSSINTLKGGKKE